MDDLCWCFRRRQSCVDSILAGVQREYLDVNHVTEELYPGNPEFTLGVFGAQEPEAPQGGGTCLMKPLFVLAPGYQSVLKLTCRSGWYYTASPQENFRKFLEQWHISSVFPLIVFVFGFAVDIFHELKDQIGLQLVGIWEQRNSIMVIVTFGTQRSRPSPDVQPNVLIFFVMSLVANSMESCIDFGFSCHHTARMCRASTDIFLNSGLFLPETSDRTLVLVLGNCLHEIAWADASGVGGLTWGVPPVRAFLARVSRKQI
ncbi:hypothetical protein Tco_0551156 [Tanacetum coccineum]